jgi:hypothetical protein
VGLTTLPCKKKIVEKPLRNSAGFCGGGQGLSWAVKPRKEEYIIQWLLGCMQWSGHALVRYYLLVVLG